MTFFEFVQTYYIWLLVVTIILIITIIGFFADRRDKKRKAEKENLNIQSNQKTTDEIPLVTNESIIQSTNQNTTSNVLDNNFVEEQITAIKSNEPHQGIIPTESINNAQEQAVHQSEIIRPVEEAIVIPSVEDSNVNNYQTAYKTPIETTPKLNNISGIEMVTPLEQPILNNAPTMDNNIKDQITEIKIENINTPNTVSDENIVRIAPVDNNAGSLNNSIINPTQSQSVNNTSNINESNNNINAPSTEPIITADNFDNDEDIWKL